MEALDPPVTDSSFQIPFRPYGQLKLLHLTTMINVTEALFTRYMSYHCPVPHPELVPGADASALQPNNSFVTGTPNAGIDAGDEKLQIFTTKQCNSNFGTVGTNMLTQALSSNLPQLIHGLSILRSCQKMNGTSSNEFLEASLELTPNSRQSAARSWMLLPPLRLLVSLSLKTVFGQ